VAGHGRGSVEAVDRHSHSVADSTHAIVAQTAETLCECSDRDALDRIEIHSRTQRDWIIVRLEDDLAVEATNGRCTRSDQSTSEPGDGNIT